MKSDASSPTVAQTASDSLRSAPTPSVDMAASSPVMAAISACNADDHASVVRASSKWLSTRYSKCMGVHISEAAIGGAHHKKRGAQLHATVIDVEFGVSRHRIAHHGIPTEVGQGIARVAEVVSAELARPRDSKT